MTTTVQCPICPHACQLAPGTYGVCGVRTNRNGEVVAVTYARPCAMQLDPIEKKPLFHFLPGAATLSLGFVGCNLACRHCQNADISQGDPAQVPSTQLTPADAIALALHHKVRVLAYTYNEPLVNFEYVLECVRLARQAQLHNILVSAGYVNPAPLAELLPWIDAVNLDIKALDDDFYRKICKGRLAPVLQAARQIRTAGVHLEITNLIIPGLNDNPEQLGTLAQWVVQNLGPHTPLHFSRFSPCHHLAHLPPTPAATLLQARQLAQAHGAHYVYLGNMALPMGSDTRCHHCQARLIERKHYTVSKNNLTTAGTCPHCGTPAGVWQGG